MSADTLGKTGDQKVVSPLVKNLNDAVPEVRWTIAEALRILDNEK